MVNTNTNWIHSRIETNIIDNSIVEETVTVNVDFVLYQPYFSDKGVDKRAIMWNKETVFTKENGTPSFPKHGQQIYNALQWLKGGGRVLGIRLTADDSKPAFGAINIRTKEETIEEFGETGHIARDVKCLRISPCFVEIPADFADTTTLDLAEPLLMKQLAAKMDSYALNQPQTPGWKDHYLALFKVRGNGSWGNDMHIALSLDRTNEEDLEESRRYFYEVYERDSFGNYERKGNRRSVSFNQNATDPSRSVSEFIDTITETPEYKAEFAGVKTYVNTDVYDELIEEFTKYCDEVQDNTSTPIVLSKKEEPYFIDFLTLLDRKGAAYKRFLPPTDDHFAEFEAAGSPAETDFGVSSHAAFFKGGNDGKLDKSKYKVGPQPSVDDGNMWFATKSDMEAAFDNVRQTLLGRAYRGEVDPHIISPYKYQISAFIDAGNSPDVKKDMIYLCRDRSDIIAYLDCNSSPSPAAAIAFRNNLLTGFQDWQASLWPQSGVAYDVYNLRNINVQMTYEMAYLMPFIRNNFGPNRLIAGTTKGVIRTLKEINWFPSEQEKTNLLENQMNYVEDVRLNQYAIMSSRTMYLKRRSYLAVIRNCHAICEAIWVGRQILTDLRFEEDPGVAQTLAKEQISRSLQYLIVDGPCRRMVIATSQSAEDAYDNAASVTIELAFKDFIHTWRFNVVAAR
jgi:hypothetical protein